MNNHSEKFNRVGKYKEEPNRDEECNNWSKKCAKCTSRLNDTEEQVNTPEDRVVEIIQAEQKNKQTKKKH